VEDDADIRAILGAIIVDDLEHEVRIARDGRAALAMLAKDPLPSLILLDLMMPVMDGLEFLEQKNSRDELKGIPVCIITANAVSEFVPPNVVATLRKPFELDSLERIVKRHCCARLVLAARGIITR
jgi:CheY-like chemotaxis protein